MGAAKRALQLLFLAGSYWTAVCGDVDCSPASELDINRLPFEADDNVLSLLQGHASANLGRKAVVLAHERANATDAVMELSWKPIPQKDETEKGPITRPRVFDLIQGLYGVIILFFLMREFGMRTRNEASRANRPTDRWSSLQCLLQLAFFCQHSGRQPFAMEGAFFMVVGAILCMETHASSTVKDYLKTISVCMLQMLPLYWITLAVSFAMYTKDSFNPLEQLAMMPMLHKVDFYAANSVTSQYSSYWFVSTMVGLCLYFPLMNMLLVQLRVREKSGRCAMLMLFCYMVQCFCAAYLLTTSHLPQYDKYSGFSILARHFKGYPVAFCCNPLIRLPEFMMGMLVGHTLHAISADEEKDNAIRDETRRRLAWAADLSAALLLLVMVTGIVHIVPLSGHHPNGLFRVISRMNLLSPFWALVLLGSGCGDSSREWPSFVKSIFDLKPLQFFGEVSYVFYLSHTFVLHATSCFSGKNKPKCFPGALVTYYAYSLALAVVAYRIIEEPVRNLFRQAVSSEADAKGLEPVKQPFTS